MDEETSFNKVCGIAMNRNPRRGLRILVAHNVPLARNGGMSRQMGAIHDRIESRGHQIDYFTAENLPKKLRSSLSRFGFPFLAWQYALRMAERAEAYDIVNVHEPSGLFFTTWKSRIGSPIVVVTSYGIERRIWDLICHSSAYLHMKPKLKTRVTYPITSLSQSRISLRKADHILCSSSEDKGYLISWLKCAENKITRIFPGVDSIYLKAGEVRDYDKNVARLLFAGTWISRKGKEDLVQVFVKLSEKFPSLELMVLGGGKSEPEMMRDFPEKCRSRVVCVHAANDEENALAFRSADIFVLPSLFEGTPLTLIEAMASGLPVITTDICGMKDVIDTGRNGFLVPVRSPDHFITTCELLINDPSLRKRVGISARSLVLEKFLWDRVAEPIIELYESLSQNRLEKQRIGNANIETLYPMDVRAGRGRNSNIR